MKNIVAVTGYSGYIGSILCKRLTEEGFQVIGFDTNHITSNNSARLFSYTYDIEVFNNFVCTHGATTIFHLAAKSVPIDESITNPLKYYAANPGLTAHMLNRLVEMGWKGNVVFASSASVYGKSTHGPKDESYKIDPQSHYGQSKIMCEKILEAATVNGIWSAAFRFFNVAGAYKRLGDSNPHVITKICKAIYTNTPFIINGEDWLTPDGTCVRDYVHVVDVCNAMIVAATDMEIRKDLKINKFGQDIPFDVFNLGTQQGTSILELVKMFELVSGKTIPIKFAPQRPGDSASLVANPNKFIKEYNFKYQFSDMETIVKSAWEHYNGV